MCVKVSHLGARRRPRRASGARTVSPQRRLTFKTPLRPKDNFQFWCKRVSVMTALCVVVRLPRNTSTHKLTKSRALHNIVSAEVDIMLQTRNKMRWFDKQCWTGKTLFFYDQTAGLRTSDLEDRLQHGKQPGGKWTLVSTLL